MLYTPTKRRGANDVSLMVVLPSLKEGESVEEVLEKLDAEARLLRAELPGKRFEIGVLYVDDGPREELSQLSDKKRAEFLRKNTLAGIGRAFSRNDFPALDLVRCFWRSEHVESQMKWGELAGAVVDGMRISHKLGCQYVIVMDSDGQHPATLLRPMVRGLLGGYNCVMPSRYIKRGDGNEVAAEYRRLHLTDKDPEEGDASGLSDEYRRKVSLHAMKLTKRFFPRALRDKTDPLGGCFGVNLAAVDTEVLANVHDWKIALEVLVLNPHLTYGEFPYKFAERVAGESNAKLSHGVGLLKQILRLRWVTWPEWFRFGAIGGATSVLGIAILWALFHAGVPLRAAVWTELVATLALNLWVYHYDLWPGLTRWQLTLRVPPFLAVRFATMWLSAHLTVTLAHDFGLHYQAANAVGLLAGMVLNWPATKAIFNFRRADVVPHPTWAEKYKIVPSAQTHELWVVADVKYGG